MLEELVGGSRSGGDDEAELVLVPVIQKTREKQTIQRQN
jgi:hypothetical protein